MEETSGDESKEDTRLGTQLQNTLLQLSSRTSRRSSARNWVVFQSDLCWLDPLVDLFHGDLRLFEQCVRSHAYRLQSAEKCIRRRVRIGFFD